MFHTPHQVPSRWRGYQWVSSRAQGGQPMDWKYALSSQNAPNHSSDAPSPNSTLTAAAPTSPMTMNQRALARSASTPLSSLPTP